MDFHGVNYGASAALHFSIHYTMDNSMGMQDKGVAACL